MGGGHGPPLQKFFRHTKFGKHAKGGFGMEKGDGHAARASERFFVNELDARAGGLTKLAFDVIRAEGNMMDAAGGIFLKEFRDGTVRAGGFKEFEVNFTDGKEGGADFLRRDFFTVVTFQAEGLFIVRHGLIEGWDGDAEMVNLCDHNLSFADEGQSRPARRGRSK